jgi:hypothetical protein
MRLCTLRWIAFAACLIEPFAMRCAAQQATTNVTLVWNPSATPGVTNYMVSWGTSSRGASSRNSTNYINNTIVSATTCTISNLDADQLYYFSVQAVGTNELATSAYSNEVTNGPPATTSLPPPPGGSSNTNPPIVINPPPPPPPPGGGGSGPSTNMTQSMFWGVPPFLRLAVSNGQANLTINGTVGALMNIVETTNNLIMNQWSAVTNVTLTNIASVGETNQPGQPQDLLDVTFVPATQTLPVGATPGVPLQYFQVAMPYDYAILADQVLLDNSNYTPRLIVVNMPGLVDDACYVNQSSSFIHYTRANTALQLFSSGPTIRQIANTLASSLNLDWTSASEFTYSNGMGQVLATVIETEPPSSDPVAGQNAPSSPIVINF